MNNNLFPLPVAAEVRPAEADLARLASVINAEHEAGEGATRKGLEHFRKAGEALITARTACGTRKFKPWLKKQVDFGRTTAYAYIKLAQNWAICSAAEHLRDALRLLTDDEEDEAEAPVEPDGEAAPEEAPEDAPPPDEEGAEEEQAPHEEELPPFTLSGGRPVATYYLLDDWGALAKSERQRIVRETEGTANFNAQGDNENIEWALWSWNPVTGCLHNCPYCYARDIAERFYEQKFAPAFWPGRLGAPRRTPFPDTKAAEWMGHKNVFVCSMADLFGRWVPREWIDAVLAEVRAAPKWNFLFLTKFPTRMAEFDFPENAWVGTSVDCQARVANAEKAFRKVKAGVKWLSCEPLIEPLAFSDLAAFDWMVIGGASRSAQTPEWRPPRRWVERVEDAADAAGVRVYEKTNLGVSDAWRRREYPGVAPAAPPAAPPPLQYLPTDTKNSQ